MAQQPHFFRAQQKMHNSAVLTEAETKKGWRSELLSTQNTNLLIK